MHLDIKQIEEELEAAEIVRPEDDKRNLMETAAEAVDKLLHDNWPLEHALTLVGDVISATRDNYGD